MNCTVHECWECGLSIAQKEGYQITAIAAQIGVAMAPDGGLICKCGRAMETREMVICIGCGAPYDKSNGDGYCGLCPRCADGAETPTSTDPCDSAKGSPWTANHGELARLQAFGKLAANAPAFPMKTIIEFAADPSVDNDERLIGLEHLRARKTATILAALRLWQSELYGIGMVDKPKLHDIATDGGTLALLTDEEIDTLCERLNQ